MEKKNIADLYKDLPQLIVALDSLEDDANYIHIKDAKENTTYYCPCCKRIVKPRAYKEGISYQVQSHYYHEDGGCNEESFVHYICKMWLFEKDSKFIVNGCEYSVNNIDTEKTYTTAFGNYRPDITVYTKEGKVFFFEIKYSNKKTEHYIPKWDELGIDVVEVDARYFINKKVENNTPEFNLIYSDGECFIKSYTRKDYDETIALRKLEWKRQDKLNYKIMWEKLDWFWTTLQEFKEDENKKGKLIESFKCLEFNDIEICWNIINKMSCCKNIKDSLRKILNKRSINKYKDIVNLFIDKYKDVLKLDDISYQCEPRKYISFNFTVTGGFVKSEIIDSICFENRSSAILPSFIFIIKDIFHKKENELDSHLINTDILRNKYNWNNAPMLYDKNIFCKNNDYYNGTIYDSRIFSGLLYESKYISDINYAIKVIDSNILQEVSRVHASNLQISSRYAIKYYVSQYIKNNLPINSLFKEMMSDENLIYSYDDMEIIKFKFDDVQITYDNKMIYHNIASEKSLNIFIQECIDMALNNFQKLFPIYDMISDIKLFEHRNNSWNFNFDNNEKKIKIVFKYKVPCYEKYIKEVLVKNEICIDDLVDNTCKLMDYKKVVGDILNNRLAPVMQTMLDEEIQNYNSTHINSILYKTSEVKQYDK